MRDRPPGTRPIGGSALALGQAVVATIGAFYANRVTWAIPLALVLIIVAALFGALSLVPAIAPFVYPLL